MSFLGLSLCTRYAYPPNSLSLCGPAKQKDLEWYSTTFKPDKGAIEILSQFSTLFPYLTLIAGENHIFDPFDEKVVEAYWVGNSLLSSISHRPFLRHLEESLDLKRKIDRQTQNKIYDKATSGGFPHHSFHVLNIYKRTGHMDIPHTIETMDACIINFGKVKKIESNYITVSTSPLILKNEKIGWGELKTRKLILQGKNDTTLTKISIGDFVSYHWGYVCTKLSKQQVTYLRYFTDMSIKLANTL